MGSRENAQAIRRDFYGPWLPSIQKLQDDPDPGVRKFATNLLQSLK
jgi:hypothetical protein